MPYYDTYYNNYGRYSDLEPAGPGPSGTWFDGTTIPKIRVGIHVSGVLQRASNAFVLDGTGLLNSTFYLTDGQWVDVTNDLRSFVIERGRDSSVDSAQPGTCTVLLEDDSDTYNFMNPGKAYPKNIFTGAKSDFEDGTVGGWVKGTFFGDSCTIANSTAAAHSGTHSLAMTAARDGDMFAVGPAAAIDVLPGQRVQALAWFKAATRASTQVKVYVQWFDVAGVFIREDTFFGPPSSTTQWVSTTVDADPPDYAAKVTAKVAVDGVLLNEVHYVDDVQLNVSQIDVGLPLRVQTEWNGTVYSRFFGAVTDVNYEPGYTTIAELICSDGLESLGRSSIGITSIVQPADGYSGDTIRAVANGAKWPTSLQAIDKGSSRLGRILETESGLALAQKIEKSELGLLFVDGEGRLIFWDRHRIATDSRTTTIQATFDNTFELGELGASKSTVRVYNDWHITRAAGSNEDIPIEKTAQDVASVARYGILSGPSGFGELNYGDEDAQAAAEFLTNRYRGSQARVSSITIEAIALGQWATLLPLGLLDRIQISNTWGQTNVHLDLLIQKTHEAVSVDNELPTWTFTFTTEPTVLATPFFKMDGTQLLNNTGTLGW